MNNYIAATALQFLISALYELRRVPLESVQLPPHGYDYHFASELADQYHRDQPSKITDIAEWNAELFKTFSIGPESLFIRSSPKLPESANENEGILWPYAVDRVRDLTEFLVQKGATEHLVLHGSSGVSKHMQVFNPPDYRALWYFGGIDREFKFKHLTIISPAISHYNLALLCNYSEPGLDSLTIFADDTVIPVPRPTAADIENAKEDLRGFLMFQKANVLSDTSKKNIPTSESPPSSTHCEGSMRWM